MTTPLQQRRAGSLKGCDMGKAKLRLPQGCHPDALLHSSLLFCWYNKGSAGAIRDYRVAVKQYYITTVNIAVIMAAIFEPMVQHLIDAEYSAIT
jgi:hypothetical protein